MLDIRHAMLIFLGGGLGSTLRWLLASVALAKYSRGSFPTGTLTVNIVGCAIAGLLAGLLARNDWLSQETRLFVFTGILGGFTTFSAFSIDFLTMTKRGDWLLASAYVLASVIGGLIVALGMYWIATRSAGQ